MPGGVCGAKLRFAAESPVRYRLPAGIDRRIDLCAAADPTRAGGHYAGSTSGLERMSEPGEQEFRIAFDGVYLKRGERSIFNGLSCGFPRSRISVVLGGSGAGKSTLIRMIGGLQRPDSGSVRVAEQDITAFSERQLFKVRDRIGMLFQGGALLDSMTVFENVALPLREHTRLSDMDILAEVNRRLVAVGLAETGHLYPRELSGGMGRRAASGARDRDGPRNPSGRRAVFRPGSNQCAAHRDAARRSESTPGFDVDRDIPSHGFVTPHGGSTGFHGRWHRDRGATDRPVKSEDERIVEFLNAESDRFAERHELDVTPLMDRRGKA